MSTNLHRCFAVALAALAAATTLVVDAADVEACSPAAEQLDFFIPADGANLPEAPSIFGVFGGYPVDRDIELTVLDGGDDHPTGEPVEFEKQDTSLAGFELRKTKLIPEEPLEEGDYAVSIVYTDEDEEGHVQDEMTTFTIDESYDGADEPEEPNFVWTNRPFDSTCYGNRTTKVEIFASSEAPDYYEIIVEEDDGTEHRSLVAPDDDEDRLTQRMTAETTDCVTVTGVMSDGTTSEPAQECSEDELREDPPLEPGTCSTAGGGIPGGLVAVAVLGLLVVLRRDTSCEPTTVA